MTCSACGTENPDGRKFCRECGSALAVACPACGAANTPGDKFCGECGAVLDGQAPTLVGEAAQVPRDTVPAAERRLVSVLFADLVGFTTLSETRDAEEVRELLTRYFETCRTLIARYGGTIEKFIGDAVMAVWGTPTAQEDDAERAVRAALDLTAAVAALGQEVGAPDLKARAGVLTGEAAVTIGAEGQGMVAGDLVNTASRIQSAASPGTVLVGDVTRRATEAAISHEDAGEHDLKGKAEPVRLWRAERVVAGRGGALRTSALEPPFVGRDREMRLVKELFHASAEERKAHLVSIMGVGGIGKSRVTWEFEKYIDGLVGNVWWHRGRCLAYGDGVAFWALAEMIRMRAEIAENEEGGSARAKLRAAVEEHVPDPEERRWVEPRLSGLLGIEERGTGDQESLFSAWRAFFERMSDEGPVVMVFEDIHWADSALLDFIEYLLEWSKDRPIFILTLSRPELVDRRPTWGAGRRNFTSLFLEPLPDDAMDTLLAEPVPGLPDELRAKILERAEGVPFYAVETVRMLLDRGLIVREGDGYRTAAAIETLEVPETLQALIAARLDGLSPEERKLLQDASVLGRFFTKEGLTALTGLSDEELEPILSTLIRKELLTLQTDPRSPERGQYGFLQDLVKRVAYETLAKKDRKARHLAVAAHLEAVWGFEEGEFAEVIAAHYQDAYRAAPDAPDAGEIKVKARESLVRAAQRAASLAATEEAQRYFDHATELAEDPLDQAELLERAGVTAWSGVRADEAAARFERSIALFEAQGATHPAARVSARLAEVLWQRGRLEQGVESMDRSFQILSSDEPDEDLAWLAAQVGRFMYFAGETDLAADRIEAALHIAEALGLTEIFSHALNTKSLILNAQGRWMESRALLRYALEVALEHDKPSAALRAYNNLADLASSDDRYQESDRYAQEGLILARRVGSRFWEWSFLGLIYPLFALGRWDEALASREELPQDWSQARAAMAQGYWTFGTAIRVHRGELEEAERLVKIYTELGTSADVQERAEYACGSAMLFLAKGNATDALQHAQVALETRDALAVSHQSVKESFAVAVEAALELNDLDKARELVGILDGLPAGRRPQFLEAHSMRFHAKLAERRGNPDRIEPDFKAAAGLFREMAIPFWMAVTLLEHGEWLSGQGRAEDANPLLDEAREIFERLKAKPWIERLDEVSPMVAVER